MCNNIDPILKETVHEQINNIVPPPKEEVWENIKVGLRKERKRNRLRYSKPVTAACLALIILVTLATFDTPVKAFTIKIIRSIEEITGDILIIRKMVGYDFENEILDDVGSKSDDPRIDEAQDQVSFEILVPGYIPEDYELYTVDVSNRVKENETVTLLYVNTKDEHNRESFDITMQSLSIGSESELNYVIDASTSIEHININSIEYTLLNHGEMNNILIWDNDKLSYRIIGNISKEDIIEIAKSMQAIN